MPENTPLSIGDADQLEVILITNDENGFNVNEAAVLHYRVKAGEAEISRGSVLLPDITPFGQQYFWSGMLDLTDSGATTLLPSYTVDVWVSGSDEAGNPYDTIGNSMEDAFSSWPLALLGPRFDLQDEATTLQWDVPSPYVGETATMVVSAKNLGGNGLAEFALQQLVEGGYWSTISTVPVDAVAGNSVSASLPVVANAAAGSSVEYRVLVLVDGVEMDRHTVASLLVKEETVRDGAASRNNSPPTFSASPCLSWHFFPYPSACMRLSSDVASWPRKPKRNLPTKPMWLQKTWLKKRFLRLQQPQHHQRPPQPSHRRALWELSIGPNHPLPPTGLPDGWTEEQWSSYGWQYIDALRSNEDVTSWYNHPWTVS